MPKCPTKKERKVIASFIRSLFCLHKWKRLAERTVIETFFGREDGRYDVLTEECEKCGKIRQINLRGK